MADNQLITKYRRKHKRTTIADPGADYREDLLDRHFTPAVPTTSLCGDITYLRTAHGWMYLATVIDLTTRMVVGWQVGDRMSAQLVVDALMMAHQAGYVAGNAVFHSDRGSQYTSKQFTEAAERLDVRLSIGAVGACWDNAVAESFFSTLKLHLLFDRKQFPSKFDARFAGIFSFAAAVTKSRPEYGSTATNSDALNATSPLA
ncbi:IS3 family transposase [Corynebacterium cystitidis]